jgi:hypothetical protein
MTGDPATITAGSKTERHSSASLARESGKKEERMIGLMLWSAAGCIVVILGLVVLLHDLSQFKERTIDEVPEFLRPEGERIDEMLFDPAVDGSLRALRVPVNFRRKQRARLDLAARYYASKNHRVRVLLQWGNTEWHDMHAFRTQDEYSQDALKNLAILRRKGKRYNRLVLRLRAKIWAMRIVMRLDKLMLLPTPDIARLRRIATVDMLALYQEIKAATLAFGRTYGEETEHELASLL